MQNWWTIYYISRIKEREILQRAEMYHLLERCQCDRGKPHFDYSGFLNRLGKMLVSWGLFLQHRSGAAYRR